MRILFLLFNQVGQGSYWRAFNYGRQLARRGHTVTVIATSRKQRWGMRASFRDGMTLVESPDLLSGSLRSGWDLWNTLNRICWVRNRRYDLIHLIEGRPTGLLPALYLRRRHHIPIVMDWCDWFGRGGSVEERSNPLVRAILRPVETFFEEHYRTGAAGNIAICTTLKRKAVELGIPAEDILLLPNCADPEHLSPIPLDEARNRCGGAANELWIGHVGTIFRRDALLMAEAFDLVRQQAEQARLIVAGYCPIDLRKLVRHPEAVIQTGYIETARLNDFLAACDIFWLPLSNSNANRGRFPLKLTDYMGIGRPTVATAVGDIPELFATSPIGLVSLAEAKDFGAATLQLAGDPGLRQILGQNAQRLAREHFNWESRSFELDAYYQAVLARFAKAQPSPG